MAIVRMMASASTVTQCVQVAGASVAVRFDQVRLQGRPFCTVGGDSLSHDAFDNERTGVVERVVGIDP